MITRSCHHWRLLLILLAFPLHLLAQLDIQDARGYTLGSAVTVSGIVTNGSELGSIRFLQDASAGIAAYPGTGSVPNFSPQPGDQISVTGTLKDFNGLLEIDPIQSFTVINSGNALPSPKLIAPSEMGERVEGQLVRIDNVKLENGGFFNDGLTSFSSLGESAAIYLSNGHPLDGSAAPTGLTSIQGIASQYLQSGIIGDYQLLPRGPNDVITSNPVHIVDRVLARNVTPTSFELHWTTDASSSSHVAFGSTASLGQVIGDATLTQQHAVTVSGLTPSQMVHAQVFSIAMGDTARSTIQLYSSASGSSGDIRVYFNKSVDLSVSQGSNASTLFGLVEDTIIAYIDRAQNTLDVALYNTNVNSIVQAVNDAHARGVAVRFIAEGSNSNSSLNMLAPGIPLLYRTDGMGSGMHNKFMVIDAADDQRAWVMSGSMNWTWSSLFDDNNNVVFIQDRSLAHAYTLEFEEMWGSTTTQPDPSQALFGHFKRNNTPHFFNIGGREVECHFSPSDAVNDRIKGTLNAAAQSVRFMLFALTENSLTSTLIAANSALPDQVAGAIDQIYTSGSDHFTLVNAGVDVHAYSSPDALLHHKYAIIDHLPGSADPVVLNGSHNWSVSATTVNDENTLIIHDADLADQFHQEYSARRNDLVGIEDVVNGKLLVYPTLVTDRSHIIRTTAAPAVIELYDPLGALVHRTNVFAAHSTIDLSGLAAGPYILSIRDANGPQQVRIIKAGR